MQNGTSSCYSCADVEGLECAGDDVTIQFGNYLLVSSQGVLRSFPCPDAYCCPEGKCSVRYNTATRQLEDTLCAKDRNQTYPACGKCKDGMWIKCRQRFSSFSFLGYSETVGSQAICKHCNWNNAKWSVSFAKAPILSPKIAVKLFFFSLWRKFSHG